MQSYVENTLVLYDVTSTYFEGRTCPLAKLGAPGDGPRDRLQIQIIHFHAGTTVTPRFTDQQAFLEMLIVSEEQILLIRFWSSVKDK